MKKTLCLAVVLFLTLVYASQKMIVAGAQNITAYDLIGGVNDLRASYGLAPYQIDAWLMSYAQEHSDFQARTGISSHVHSDGMTPLHLGIQENVAGGHRDFINVETVIYEVWNDPVHMKTMVGHPSGFIGVGIAERDTDVYVTLNVYPGDDITTPAHPSPAYASGSTPFIPVARMVTTTPLADGSLIHPVGYGNTLWGIAIAYGVKIDDIRRLNKLGTDTNAIYAGQKLLVRPACSATPVVTPTPQSGLIDSTQIPIPNATAEIRAQLHSPQGNIPAQFSGVAVNRVIAILGVISGIGALIAILCAVFGIIPQ